MKNQIILYQKKHEIEYQTKLVNDLAKNLTEKVLEISDMIGELPKHEDLVDFQNGGNILHDKLTQATAADAKKFRSSSAIRAFDTALQQEKERLSEIRIIVQALLGKHYLHFGIFDMDGNGMLTVKKSYLEDVIEQNTIRATGGSPRFRIFELCQIVTENLEELRQEMLKHGVKDVIPVSIDQQSSRDGLVYAGTFETSPIIIQSNFFDSISDEVLEDAKD